MKTNAAIHQKSLSEILYSLTPLISEILEQDVKEGYLHCQQPKEYAEIILSVFTFLLDPGIFHWTAEEKLSKLQAFAQLLEKGLSANTGSFDFLYKI